MFNNTDLEEYVELVALDYFRRRVILVVMSLVILVPFIALGRKDVMVKLLCLNMGQNFGSVSKV